MAPSVIRKRLTPGYPFALEVELDGGDKQTIGLRLNYDMNSACLVEDRTGFPGLSGKIFNSLTAVNVTILLWAMVQANHPEYAGDEGLAEIRSLLTLRNSAAVSDAVQECFIRNLPDDRQVIIRKAIADAAEAAKKKAAGEPGGASPLEETTLTPAA